MRGRTRGAGVASRAGCAVGGTAAGALHGSAAGKIACCAQAVAWKGPGGLPSPWWAWWVLSRGLSSVGVLGKQTSFLRVAGGTGGASIGQGSGLPRPPSLIACSSGCPLCLACSPALGPRLRHDAATPSQVRRGAALATPAPGGNSYDAAACGTPASARA